MRSAQQLARTDMRGTAEARGAGQTPDSRRMTGERAMTQSRALTAMNAHGNVAEARFGANGRTEAATQTASPKSGLTPASLASHAAENARKPPATQTAHKAWYHWFWW
jgi:hypothetical protein